MVRHFPLLQIPVTRFVLLENVDNSELASCLIYAWTVPAHPRLSQQALKWAVTNQLSGRGKAAT